MTHLSQQVLEPITNIKYSAQELRSLARNFYNLGMDRAAGNLNDIAESLEQDISVVSKSIDNDLSARYNLSRENMGNLLKETVNAKPNG